MKYFKFAVVFWSHSKKKKKKKLAVFAKNAKL